MHMCRVPFLFCANRMGAPYRLALRWIQLRSRYVSSYLYTLGYSVGDKRYCLGLGGWASRSSRVRLCVMWSKGKKVASTNMSENLSNKAEIYGSLAPWARGVWGPSYSPLSMSLAPIARRPPDGHNNMNRATLYDLQAVLARTSKSSVQPEPHTTKRYPAPPNHQILQT